MSYRVILDECHDELLFLANTQGLQLIFSKLDCVILPYVLSPITYEKIKDDHILLLGCPRKEFTDNEIKDIIRFVEDGKILILISESWGDSFYDKNLNFLARHFDFEFSKDQVEYSGSDEAYSNMVGISEFYTVFFSENVQKILYSGCSINRLDPSVRMVARTGAEITPAHAVISVLSGNNRVFGIGGWNLFIDHAEYGIERENNVQFLYNVFSFLVGQLRGETLGFSAETEIAEEYKAINDSTEFEKQVSGQSQDPEQQIVSESSSILSDLIQDQENFYWTSDDGLSDSESSFILTQEETGIEENSIEALSRGALEDSPLSELIQEVNVGDILNEIKRISPKKAGTKFVEICKPYLDGLDRIQNDFDDFWLFIKKFLATSKLSEGDKKSWGTRNLEERYKRIQEEITSISIKINDIFNIFCANFSQDAFNEKNLEEWYVAESELRQKIDMIRNNLLALLN